MKAVSIALAVGLGLGCSGKTPPAVAPPRGTQIVFEYDAAKFTPPLGTSVDRVDHQIVSLLKARMGRLGLAGDVASTGNGRFVLHLDSTVDAKRVTKNLTSKAEMAFFDASSLQTGTGVSRLYLTGPLGKYKGGQAYDFALRDPSHPIKAGTPEYVQMIKTWRTPILDGHDLDYANAESRGGYCVPVLKFNLSGSIKLEDWSRRHQLDGEQLAIVVDGAVVSVAPLMKGTILRGLAEIHGDFDKKYVLDLVDRMNYAALPVQLSVKAVNP